MIESQNHGSENWTRLAFVEFRQIRTATSKHILSPCPQARSPPSLGGRGLPRFPGPVRSLLILPMTRTHDQLSLFLISCFELPSIFPGLVPMQDALPGVPRPIFMSSLSRKMIQPTRRKSQMNRGYALQKSKSVLSHPKSCNLRSIP